MRSEIRHNPDFGVVKITFDYVGEQISTEAGAMVAKDSSVDMQTNLQGGIGSAMKRRLLHGESLFQNSFTATAPGQTLYIAPPSEGCVETLVLEPGKEIYLQSGAYLASTPGLALDTKWQGSKGFFAGGLFLLRAYGQGQIWFSSYGALHTIDIDKAFPGYVCDNSHLVGFTHGLHYDVRKLGGLKSLFFSGEGLVCEFSGEGRLWLQTKSPNALAHFLHPFRPVGAKKHE
jgi:uncharacterized protein (TIGR00266 family)